MALSGLENILSYGEAEAKSNGQNPYAIIVEECYGLDKIEFLQSHEVCMSGSGRSYAVND